MKLAVVICLALSLPVEVLGFIPPSTRAPVVPSRPAFGTGVTELASFFGPKDPAPANKKSVLSLRRRNRRVKVLSVVAGCLLAWRTPQVDNAQAATKAVKTKQSTAGRNKNTKISSSKSTKSPLKVVLGTGTVLGVSTYLLQQDDELEDDEGEAIDPLATTVNSDPPVVEAQDIDSLNSIRKLIREQAKKSVMQVLEREEERACTSDDEVSSWEAPDSPDALIDPSLRDIPKQEDIIGVFPQVAEVSSPASSETDTSAPSVSDFSEDDSDGNTEGPPLGLSDIFGLPPTSDDEIASGDTSDVSAYKTGEKRATKSWFRRIFGKNDQTDTQVQSSIETIVSGYESIPSSGGDEPNLEGIFASNSEDTDAPLLWKEAEDKAEDSLDLDNSPPLEETDGDTPLLWVEEKNRMQEKSDDELSVAPLVESSPALEEVEEETQSSLDPSAEDAVSGDTEPIDVEADVPSAVTMEDLEADIEVSESSESISGEEMAVETEDVDSDSKEEEDLQLIAADENEDSGDSSEEPEVELSQDEATAGAVKESIAVSETKDLDVIEDVKVETDPTPPPATPSSATEKDDSQQSFFSRFTTRPQTANSKKMVRLPLSEQENLALQRKYAALPLEERAYQILLDLGMIDGSDP